MELTHYIQRRIVKRLYLICLILLILLPRISLKAQENIDQTIIHGKVIDQKNLLPIPFATIYLKGYALGTVSNHDGEFELVIPNEYQGDSVSVSYMGFKTLSIALGEENTSEEMIITLEESTIILDEVLINDEKLTADMIMQKAFENLQSKYTDKDFIMEGFYRYLHDQDNESSCLVEAAFESYDSGFNPDRRGKKNRKFYLQAVRTSQNQLHELLSYVLEKANFITYNFEEFNLLEFEYNQWKQGKRTYVFDEIIDTDGRKIFVVSYSRKNVWQQGENNWAKGEQLTKFYIDADTYFIHKIFSREIPLEGDYYQVEPPYQGTSLKYGHRESVLVREYQEYQDFMYLRYYSLQYPFDFYNIDANTIEHKFLQTHSMVITDIDIDSKKPEGKRMSSKGLFSQSTDYDQEFWNDKSNARLVPLTQKQRIGLERQMPLEEQFMLEKK